MLVNKERRHKEEQDFLKQKIIEHHHDYLDYDFRDKDDTEAENELLIALNSEYISSEMVDYTIDKEGKMPISFTKIQNVEQGIAWYKYHHSNYPDSVIEIICRKQFGKLPQKHYRKRRLNKKEKMIVCRKNVVLEF